ncbi:hypothetical protein Tco_1518030 [Tanacetum coccineum]
MPRTMGGNDAEDVLNGMEYDREIDDMLRIKLREAESNEEIFTSMAWIRAFNIKEPIYMELCHEFYSTYEFDEVCADDELQSKKIIKFRLGGRAHNLTLLEFAHRLGLTYMVGSMEIRQEAIERMEYRQSYHWDKYPGVFEHMARVYTVPLQGAYNPPGNAQPQYDQYYQQYSPPPPQYQQQQQDDDE